MYKFNREYTYQHEKTKVLHHISANAVFTEGSTSGTEKSWAYPIQIGNRCFTQCL